MGSSSYDKKKGVLSSKLAPKAKASANAAGAAKVEKPAGSKVDFTVTAPFTFEKPPLNANP